MGFDALKGFHRRALLLDSLTLYGGIRRADPVRYLQELLDSLVSANPQPQEIIRRYHRFTALAVEKGWPGLVLDLILEDGNSFSQLAARVENEAIDPYLKNLAARDLNLLQELASTSSHHIIEAVAGLFSGALDKRDELRPENWPRWEDLSIESALDQAGMPGDTDGAPAWLAGLRENARESLKRVQRWGDAVDELARYYHAAGCGTFSRYVAFRWQGQPAGITGISRPDSIRMEQLIGLERELGMVLENTEHFLSGLPANNMILYGNRGTGKSSVIKSLLHAYAARGLRLVEISKADLSGFTQAVRVLAEQPKKFIIFIDDLSFDEAEPEYKMLKTVLEGTLEGKPGNVLIYATSNRRHLVKENFSDRRNDEIHGLDTMEEKLSLADRFGITVTFATPDQEEFLRIVEGLAGQRRLVIDRTELHQLALRWEMRHNGRSGRTARQFVDYLTASRFAGDSE